MNFLTSDCVTRWKRILIVKILKSSLLSFTWHMQYIALVTYSNHLRNDFISYCFDLIALIAMNHLHYYYYITITLPLHYYLFASYIKHTILRGILQKTILCKILKCNSGMKDSVHIITFLLYLYCPPSFPWPRSSIRTTDTLARPAASRDPPLSSIFQAVFQCEGLSIRVVQRGKPHNSAR